jgi:hypothetical protein
VKRVLLALLLVGCAARSEIGAPQPEGGVDPCGAGYACPPPGSYYDCMPPVSPQLELVCGDGACHDWVLASCPGVSFAY